MTRIAVGGFLHETNTFAPTKATYDDFVHGGGWPAMAQGAKLLEKMRSINVGMAGVLFGGGGGGGGGGGRPRGGAPPPPAAPKNAPSARAQKKCRVTPTAAPRRRAPSL